MTIQVWSDEEAVAMFKRIEVNEGRGEWTDLEWKEKIIWDETGIKSQNTFQRAASGFANTEGGTIIIGFDSKGKFDGWEVKSDIENEIYRNLKKKLSPIVPGFKTQDYAYKDNKTLVVFIEKSKKPIMCDNGVYYYRTQSEFRVMPYEMLQTKFREDFEEEKYLYLVKMELKQLWTVLGYRSNPTYQYIKIENSVNYFFESSERLHHFYMINNLSEAYKDLRMQLITYIADEGTVQAITIHNPSQSLRAEINKFMRELGEDVSK